MSIIDNNKKASNNQQSPHWLDKLVKQIQKWKELNDIDQLHVDDMKTPSGRVHTGALRGVLLHDLVNKALLKAGETNSVNSYVFNDMDPMDGLPSYLDESEYKKHMGKPMFKIPAPNLNKSGFNVAGMDDKTKAKFHKTRSFAEFYANDFLAAFNKLGANPKIIWSHELYESGKMNKVIEEVLNNVDKIKKIYKDTADYELPDNWFPFQVICPQCGKIGTTLTTAWNGEMVSFECQKNKVSWAEGCGYKGEISPFNGNGKLLWKVDWPSHWKVIGVNIEGSGKDHTSAGGSRDMANAVCKNVINITVPFDIPYEWILIRGAKMSSSKGVGTSAFEFVELFPSEVGRFLFVSRHYNKVIDFDPSTMSIPDLFDEYDKGARIFWKEEEGDLRLARSFELSQLNDVPEKHFIPRFRDIATWMQYPEVSLVDKFTSIKGSDLTKHEKELIKERQHYAQVWIARYAPEEFRLTPSEDVPKEAVKLSDQQLNYLDKVLSLVIEKKDWRSEDLQQRMYDIAKESMKVKDAFQSIYLALIGKKAGPRAANLLLSVDKSILSGRTARIREMKAKLVNKKYLYTDFRNSEIFNIDTEFAKKYPSAIVGVAIIKGVTIKKHNPILNSRIEEFVRKNSELTAQMVNDYSEIASYRKMYAEMGVKWSSKMASPAALLRRIAQAKKLFSINTCVDAYNLIVMKNRVSAGAFDLDQFKFPTQLRIAKGGEKALYIGDDKELELKKGEVCYFDQIGPYNMDYNHRDIIRTQVTEGTKNLLINIEGIYSINRDQVEKSLQEVISTIQEFCGGKVQNVGIVEAEKVIK